MEICWICRIYCKQSFYYFYCPENQKSVMQRRREACTFRTVLADFAVCDWRPYCKTPCDKKCIQLEGNGQQFSHITVCWVLWFNKRSQQKVYNALFSKGSVCINIVSQRSGTEIYIQQNCLGNSLTAELIGHCCRSSISLRSDWLRDKLSFTTYCSLAQTSTKSSLAKTLSQSLWPS